MPWSARSRTRMGERIVLVHDGARPAASSYAGRRRHRGGRTPRGGDPGRAGRRDAQAGRRRSDRGDGRPDGPRRGTDAAGCAPLAPPRRRSRPSGAEDGTWTDEAALLEACRIAVHVVPGDPANLKVTVPADLERAASLLGGPARPTDRRSAATSIPSDPASRCDSVVSRSPVRLASTAIPMATSRCMRRRCAARGGFARRPRSHVPGRTGDAATASIAGSCSTGGRRPSARRRLAARRGRPDDRRRRDRVSPGISMRWRRDRWGAAATARGHRGQGVDGQPRRSRGRRTRHLRTRARDDRADPMSDLRLPDTLSGETRPLVPLDGETVRIYSCGPTVYGPAHIGNFRSFLFADLLVRYLRWRGYQVTLGDEHHRHRRQDHQGRRRCRGDRPRALADRYLARFLDDAETLRMTRPDVLPRATEHIEPIVGLIQTLIGTRARVSDRRRVDLLPYRVVAVVWPAGAPRSGADAGRRARRGRRIREGRRARLRPVEGREAR